MVPCRCRGVLLYHAEGAGFVKMEISSSRISRVEPFQNRLCGDSPSADGGNVPRPAAGQEGRHQGFYPLNSHFLLFLSLAQTGDRRPLRKGERQSGYRYVCFVKYSQFTDSVLLHITESLSRRDIPVSRNSLTCYTARHLRIRHLVQFILADPVYYNALTNCAARLCRACGE